MNLWASLHDSMQEMSFLVDSGASVSLLPLAWYESMPDEVRPPLRRQHVDVYGGGTDHPIHIVGVITVDLTINGYKYETNFHVASNEEHGILGTCFLARYDGLINFGRKELMLLGRKVPLYNRNGARLSHRVVSERTMHISPGERFVVTGLVRGRGFVDKQPLVVEGAKSVYNRSGVMVARITAIPHGSHIPLEVVNMSNETQTIYKNQTLGVASPALEARLFEQTAAAEMERTLLRDRGAFNDDTTEAEAEQAAPTEESEAAYVNRVLTEYQHVPRNNPDLLKDYDYSSPRMFRTEPAKTREESMLEKEQRWTSSTKPFPGYTKCTWNTDDILYEYGDVPPALNVKLLPFHMQELFVKVTATWTDPWEILGFYHLCDSFHEAFAKDGNDLGSTDLVKHHIDTGDERPFKQKIRRFPLAQQDEIKSTVYKLADKGIIRPSTSPYGSNVLLVKKKDGTWRMCIDYRQLNRQTKNLDPYPVPRTDATLDALGGAKFFCTLDLLQGYHQCELSESSKPKTAFLTPMMTPCQWEYNYLPYGVTGGPATFMRVMDTLLHGIAYRIALAYMDDIIVFAPTRLACMDRLAEVFNRLIDAGLKLKASKCTFFEEETAYLGHVISKDGIKTDPAKVQAVMHWKPPRTSKQVQEFCGFVNYYNRFIKDYSETAKPLYALTQKRAKWEWTDACEQAFQKLRKQLCEAPVLAYPRSEGQWILDTDASGYAIGAVLSQMQLQDDGTEVEKVVSYASRALKGPEQRYCTRRRELLAVVHFVKHFRPYIWGRHVLIRTDHASLRYIKTQGNPDDQSLRWINHLEGTRYTIEVRQGKKHCNADALSRLPAFECKLNKCVCRQVADLEATGDYEDDYTFQGAKEAREQPRFDADGQKITAEFCHAVRIVQEWDPVELAEEQKNDVDTALLYAAKAAGDDKPHGAAVSPLSEAAKNYLHDWRRIHLHTNGVLYRTWESDDGTQEFEQVILPVKYQEMVYRAAHEAPTSGHMGRRRTLQRLLRKYYWHKMADDIKLWIQTCDVCQRRKRGCKPARSPLVAQVSGNPNERVAMDVIDHLRTTVRGNCCILTITDYFTKYVVAEPMPNQQASTIARAFHKGWIRYFGAPHILHTDQGTSIDGWLMQELCKMLHIDKTRTTPYHPQSDGQVERFNQTLMNAIHAYARNDPDHWDDHIDNATLAYNSTRHSVTGYEPCRLMLSRNVYMPTDLMIPDDPDTQPQFTNEFVKRQAQRMRFIYTIVRERLQRAATAAKRYYDRRACLYPYKEGDAVRVKLFRLNKGTKKFEDYYEGPYFIIDVLGVTTFRVAKGPHTKRRVLNHDSLLPYHSRDTAQMNLDSSWVLPLSKTWRRHELTDSCTQTEAVELPSVGVQVQCDDTLIADSAGDAEEHVVAPPAEDDALRQSRTRYNLRSRSVPQSSPPAADKQVDRQPRKRGRPRKVQPEGLANSSAQTDIQIAVRWASG